MRERFSTEDYSLGKVLVIENRLSHEKGLFEEHVGLTSCADAPCPFWELFG